MPRWRGIQWHAVHVEFHEKVSVIICNTGICSSVGTVTDPHSLLNRVLEREMLGCSGTLIKELGYFDTFSVTHFWLTLFGGNIKNILPSFTPVGLLSQSVPTPSEETKWVRQNLLHFSPKLGNSYCGSHGRATVFSLWLCFSFCQG
jgi:hypothetical protein